MIPSEQIDRARGVRLDDELSRRGIKLRGRNGSLEGPCPVCGGTDRFAVNTKKPAFNCRGCGIKGGDAIALTMALDGCDFREAVETLTGQQSKTSGNGQAKPAQTAKRIVVEHFDYHDAEPRLLFRLALGTPPFDLKISCPPMENTHPPLARQTQKLDVVENLRLLRDSKPRGRRRGAMRYRLRMRLPFAIFVLDDGREVLVDRRNRPLIERAPCRAIGVPAQDSNAEMWERQRSAIYLGNPIDRLLATEDEWIDRAEAAFRYFGLDTGDPEGGSR
jgi:hypothetical protein